jgi:SAM-dependent methyltransferase
MAEFHRQAKVENNHLFWDFDDRLQKILLGVARAIATPEQIADACVERWKTNLDSLHQRRQRELYEFMGQERSPQFEYTARDELIFANIKPGKKLLYLGCGSGRDCLKLASRSYHVVGIDTDFELTEIANEWATYLDLPFKAICMDAMELGFARGSFDGFLLEFYGAQPSSLQALALQRELAGIMSSEGMGFIVANRKKYASFWFLMRNDYPPSMDFWLRKQSLWDYHFSQPDGFEERLMYGLYSRAHTKESLSAELSHSFDVIDCFYQPDDPRYVIGVVKRKDGMDFAVSSAKNGDLEEPEKRCADLSKVSVQGILGKVGSICDLLESHERRVTQLFNSSGGFEQKGSILGTDTDLSGFAELLADVFDVLSNKSVPQQHSRPALRVD